jgi:putative two-component system response regulator
LLKTAAIVALTHHEKWDGSGYPRQLAGENIPLEARIVAISDVYDALTSARPYRKAYSDAMAVEMIGNMVASHFDPRVHAAFVRALARVRSLRRQFTDGVVVSPNLVDLPHDWELISPTRSST